MPVQELYTFAKDLQAPYHLLKETARLKRLPTVLFAAGGIATPADAALMMQLGMDGVFVGSGIVSRASLKLVDTGWQLIERGFFHGTVVQVW